jgi:SMI1 / KNR4 family (SUKH-1)
MRCVKITGSDDRMDCRHMFRDPVNPLPRKCPKCGFPDLDYVPQPYFLVKSRTLSPNELAVAANGNFFVRARIRRVLDELAPGQCANFPTCFERTTEKSPWLLAVPNHQVVTAMVNPSVPRCQACGEPRSAHPGSQWSEHLFGTPRHDLRRGVAWTAESDYDILQSSTWASSVRGWDEWISRGLYMSIRLLHLLKKIKARGLDEATCQKPVAPDKEDSAWIKEKLQLLETSGIPLHADAMSSDDDAEWFQEYMQTNARQAKHQWDIEAVEKRVKVKLPRSYVDFVTEVGPVSFVNIDERAGFTASVLVPDQLRVEGFAGDAADEESRAVNGLTFATTVYGDRLCFDVQTGEKEYRVFQFKHEYNHLEPYAANFAACIRRFAGG